MKRNLILEMFLLTSIALFSQNQNIIFNDITYKEGINTSGRYTLYQDTKGFIWIADGESYLQRYDGYEFKNYEIPLGAKYILEDSRGILWLSAYEGIGLFYPETERLVCYSPDSLNNRVNKIIEDENGTFWCASNFHGLLKMEPVANDNDQLKKMILKKGIEAAFHISVYKYDSEKDINRIDDICKDSYGNLWIGTPTGLYVFTIETGEFVRIDDDESGRTRFNHQHVFAIVEEKPGIIWARNREGFARISNIGKANTNTSDFKSSLHLDNYYYPSEGPDSYYNNTPEFYYDHKGNFWFATIFDGLIKMNVENEIVFQEIYPDVHDPEYNFGSLFTIMEDRTGLIWSGSQNKGVRSLREKEILFTPLQDKLAGNQLERYDFNQIYEDTDGNLLICTWSNGVFKISPDGRVSNFILRDPAYPELIGINTTSLVEIGKGIFLIGTAPDQGGLWQLDTNTGRARIVINSNNYHFQFAKIDNCIIIGSTYEGLWVYDLNTQKLDKYTTIQNDSLVLKSNQITSINLMKNGDIWVSTGSPFTGISRIRLNQTTGELNFMPLPGAITRNYQNILGNNDDIWQIHEGTDNILWFCTYTGLVKLDLETGDIQKWTEKEGLTCNWVNYIEEDNNGNLWIGTEFGLSVLDPITEHIKSFSEKDGLPDVKHARRAHTSFKNKYGQIYFGGVGGFYRVDPGNVYLNDMIPPVIITDFRLQNSPVSVDSTKRAILIKNISYTEEINLKYNQNDISFTFAALDFNDPSKNKYAYILEGYEDEWIETGADNRIATYTNLSPGEYTFRVKGSNNDGVWNEEGTYINITIHPPPWKTVWAYIVYGICILLLFRGYIFWRTQRLRKEKIVLEKQVSERTAELKTANTRLKDHEQELQEVNTLLEEQKEELMQQKEELQSTLENLKKAQEQLVESEKMAVVGGLVAGVAHEINTPVGIGITAISNLKDEIHRMSALYEKDQISREDFKDFMQSSQGAVNLIQKNLERTASLVQSFKQVSTDQVTEQQRIFAFREYLDDILASLRPKFGGKKIDFKIECDDKLKLNSYPGVYAQIFTNLLLNSLQHGFYEKDKGTITIKADMNKELLKIQYSDNGAGISKKDLPHIFEPFYTSDQHRGTGLGLNIIYNLVKQKLHGTIACESEQGKGVLFTIDVPVR